MKRAVAIPRIRQFAALVVAAATLGCLDDPAVAVRPDPANIFWAVTADVKALTIPMGESYTIVATPRTPTGAPISGLSRPTFRSTDTNRVKVSQDGVITALVPGPNVRIIASLQVDNVTRADTVNVNVNFEPAPRKLARLSVGPPPGDSPMVAAGDAKFLLVMAFDENSIPIPNPAVHVRTLDGERLKVQDPFMPLVFGRALGTGKVVVTTTTYGVTMSDTVELTVTYPRAHTVKVLDKSKEFDAPTVQLMAGGTVTWANEATTPFEVTFDDPTNIAGGNILPLGQWESATRQFPTPGTYTYKSTALGATGKVVVH